MDLREFSVMGKEVEGKDQICSLFNKSQQSTWCVADFEIQDRHVGAICLEGNRLEKQIIEGDMIDALFDQNISFNTHYSKTNMVPQWVH